MQLRCIGIAAFRSSARGLPFVQLLQSNRQTIIRTTLTHRALSITSRSYAKTPEPTIRAPFTPESSSTSSSSSSSTPETHNDSPSSPPTPKEDTLESLGTESTSQNLSWIQPSNHIAPSPLNSPSTQLEDQDNSPIISRTSHLKGASLLNHLSNPRIRYSSIIPSALDSPFRKMNFPIKKTGPSSSADLMRETAAAMSAPVAPRIQMRLSPRTGRSVDIKSNIDLSRGIRMLEASCATNKVRNDQSNQRFHERGGMRRKRLRRQRWRKNFMAGFRSVVDRVKQLKNQGW